MIEKAAAIKDNLFDACCLCAFGDEFADAFCFFHFGQFFCLRANRRVKGRSGDERVAFGIVNHLDKDMFAAAKDVEARPLGRALEMMARTRPPMAALAQERGFVFLPSHYLAPTFPALPALRRIFSP